MAATSGPPAKRQKFVDFVDYIDRSEKEAAAGPRGMGYPMNFHRLDELAELRTINTRNFISNNCGDPFDQGERGWHSQTFDTEANLMRQLMTPWGGTEENCWGYLTTGGTEGVTKGMSAGLHRLGLTKKRIMVIHCSQAHYSISKAAHMLCGETGGNKGLIATIPPNVKGEMEIDKLREVVAAAPSLGVDAILCVCTIGTTFMGANDDVVGVRKVLSEHGYWGTNSICTWTRPSTVAGGTSTRRRPSTNSVCTSTPCPSRATSGTEALSAARCTSSRARGWLRGPPRSSTSR